MAQWIGSPNFTSGRQGNKVQGIIIHWMVGTLASTDAVFQNKTRNTSAHYGVEDGNVHQYVNEANTAYHCGHWPTNLTTVGIEHSAAPGRPATDSTYETSAQLIADICKRHGIGVLLRGHNLIVATQCPGTMDVNRLTKRANELIGGSAPVPQPTPPPPASTNETVTVAVDTLYVRSAPTTSAPLSGSMRLHKGDQFQIVGRVQGQNVAGVSTWVKSTRGNYVWAGGLVGQTSPPVVPAPSGKPRSGVIIVTAPQGLYVRNAPNTGAPLAGSQLLSPGVQVQYVDVVNGTNVNGNPLWLKSIKGNYFWSGGTNY